MQKDINAIRSLALNAGGKGLMPTDIGLIFEAFDRLRNRNPRAYRGLVTRARENGWIGSHDFARLAQIA